MEGAESNWNYAIVTSLILDYPESDYGLITVVSIFLWKWFHWFETMQNLEPVFMWLCVHFRREWNLHTGSGPSVPLWHGNRVGQLTSVLKPQLRNEPAYPEAVDWRAYARSFKPFLSQQSDFPGMTYFDELTFTELKRNKGNYTVCHKSCVVT